MRMMRSRFERARDFLRTADGRRFAALLVAAAALRLALLPTEAHLSPDFSDEYGFKLHFVVVHADGMIEALRQLDTPYIVYLYIMQAVAPVYGWLGGDSSTDAFGLKVLVKLPPLALDVALIGGTYAAARSLRPEAPGWHALAVAGLIAFHPVVVYDSAVWAQVDALIAIVALGAIALTLGGHPVWACVVVALGIVNKPQPIIFAPVLAAIIVQRSGWRPLLEGIAAGITVFVAALAPWLIAGELDRVVEVYRNVFSSGNNVPAITQNAWNLWWFIPFETVPESKDTLLTVGALDITYQQFSLALSAAAAALAAGYAWRFNDLRSALVASAYLALAFYVLPTSTHERYMYPLVPLLAPVLVFEPRQRWLFAALSATLFLNMLLVAPPVRSWSLRWDDATATHYVAGVNVLLFGAMTWMLAADLLPRRGTAPADQPALPPAGPAAADG